MNKKGLLLVLGTAVVSGFSIFINKYAVSVANPYVFAFAKNVAVALIFSCLIFGWKNHSIISKLSRKQWINLIAIGLIGGSIPFLLFFKGLSMTSAAQGSFIHKSMFIFTAILAVAFLREKINRYFIIGAALLFLGNLLVLKTFNFSLGAGDLMVFLAVLFWSAENVLSKTTLKELDAKTVAWGRMFFGSIFILTFLISSGQTNEIFSLNLKQFGWIAVTSTLLFFYVITWYSGLKLIPVSAASSVLVLGSLITTLFTFISSGKIVSQDLYSSLFIFLGIIIILGADHIGERVKNLKNSHGWS
jgi:drug/metabolite transporter (DMT)-like permease